MQFGNVLYFLVWAGLFFVMMRYGCGAHVMGHARHGAHGDGSWHAPERAVDPVCGMTIATQGARSAVHEGHIYYFCSGNCRDKFEAAPASYAHTSPQHEGRHHGC